MNLKPNLSKIANITGVVNITVMQISLKIRKKFAVLSLFGPIDKI